MPTQSNPPSGTRDVEARFLEAYNRAGSLPATAQLQYRYRLMGLRNEVRKLQGRNPEYAGVAGNDEWEWPLKFANELDRVWSAITQQAGKVYGAVKAEAGEAVDATAKSTAILGIGLMPLALVAVAVLYFYSGAKR